MRKGSSLFMKIGMSEAACRRWLDSPIRCVSDYGDWSEMNPTAARIGLSADDTLPRPDYMSVREFLDELADELPGFFCEYDCDEEAFFVAAVSYRSSMADIASGIAALRGAEAFKDDGEPGFIYVFPAMSGGDPEALLRIDMGSSVFLRPDDSSPEALYFVDEAESFIEDLAGYND
jgi:hypothetical protein